MQNAKNGADVIKSNAIAAQIVGFDKSIDSTEERVKLPALTTKVSDVNNKQ